MTTPGRSVAFVAARRPSVQTGAEQATLLVDFEQIGREIDVEQAAP